MTRRIRSIDVAAVAYSGLDHEPLARVVTTQATPVIEQFYERRRVYGVSLEGAAGAIAYRAEFGTQPGRTFNIRNAAGLATTRLDQVVAGVGIDIDGPVGTFINVQHLLDRVRNAPAGLVRPATDRLTTLFIRRQFAYETLGVTARWYYSHELDDRMATLAMHYALSDATRVALHVDRFDGASDGLFGQFADRDRITLRLTHTF